MYQVIQLNIIKKKKKKTEFLLSLWGVNLFRFCQYWIEERYEMAVLCQTSSHTEKKWKPGKKGRCSRAFPLLKNKLNKERNEKRQKQIDAQVAKRNLQRPLFPRPPLYT